MERPASSLFVIQLLWLTTTYSTSLFTALTIVDGNSCDIGPSGDGKAVCDDNKDVLKYLNKFC